MAAGTETCPPPVLMIIVLALSREIQAKKVLPHLDFMSCSPRQPRIISGSPGGEGEGERNPGQASQRRKQPNLISNNPTWHFPPKKEEKLYFLPLFPPTLPSDSKRVEMQQPFFFSSAGFQREKKYIIEIWGGKGGEGTRVAGIQTKASNPPLPISFRAHPGGNWKCCSQRQSYLGGKGKGENVVCGERGKRISSIGCSTCMYRIYLLYKENYEHN